MIGILFCDRAVKIPLYLLRSAFVPLCEIYSRPFAIPIRVRSRSLFASIRGPYSRSKIR